MRKIYFFKAKSRIGLKNNPIHQDTPNIGVEEGSEAILSPEFLAKFPGSKVSTFEFPKPEDIAAEDFNNVLADSIKEFKNLIDSRLRGNDKVVQVVIGGDHSITLPSILAVIDRIHDTKSLGYIQFDSHGDINLRRFSPTDNFHGMYVRSLVDKFDIPEIDTLVPKKISTSNLLYIGNLYLDPEEEKFFKKKTLFRLNRNDLIARSKTTKQSFKRFVKKFKYLHVTFDIDCMDQTEASATGIPAKNGLFFKDIKPVLKIISQHSNLSFDLVEVNPRKRGVGKTIKLAQEILKFILSTHLIFTSSCR